MPVFDFVCFGVDAQARLSDDRYMVFFNQKSAPDEAIQLVDLSDQSARFSVDLAKVPSSVARLVFTASIDGTNAMRELQTGTFTIQEADGAKTTLLEYRFQGSDFAGEGALMLGELYRKDGEWRFWAQGQGFAGDLRALLKHFGGLEDSEPTTSTTPTPAVSSAGASPTGGKPTSSQPRTVAPPPPVSPPATHSSPVTVISVTSSAGLMQTQISQTPPGGTLRLTPGEYRGPIVLDRAITIQGQGAVVWAHNGPVVVVNSMGVMLSDLDIEVTAPEEGLAEAKVALKVTPGMQPRLENVRIRGEVEGIASIEGDWKLPDTLDLGEFAPRAINSYRVQVEVPNECELKTSVAGVSFVPARLASGPHELEIRVENVGADTFLAGIVEFKSGGIARTVALSGRAAHGEREAVCGRILSGN